MKRIDASQNVLTSISHDERKLHSLSSVGYTDGNFPNLDTVRSSVANIKRACIECRPGRYTGTRGQRSCNYCPGGWYSTNFSSTECSMCAAGKYSGEGFFRCETCTYDTYTNLESSDGCKHCEPGKFTRDNVNCISCPTGYYKSRYEGFCEACMPGFHNPDSGSKSSQSCRRNPIIIDTRGVSGWGYSTYGICPTGKYTSTGDIDKCEWCSGSRYTFPYGTVSAYLGSNNVEVSSIHPPKH